MKANAQIRASPIESIPPSLPVHESVEYAASRSQRVHPAEGVCHEAELCADVGAAPAQPLHRHRAGALPDVAWAEVV